MHINPRLAAILLLLAPLADAAPLNSPPVAPGQHAPAASEKPTTASSAAVAPAPLISSGMDLAKLEQIQSETLILEAQAARDKAARGVVVDSDDSTPAGGTGGAGSSGSGASTSALPRIMEISGTGRLGATLMMPDNSLAMVYDGQAISGTPFTVEKITAQGVTVRRDNGTRLTLPMGGD